MCRTLSSLLGINISQILRCAVTLAKFFSNSEILRVKFHQRQNQYGLFIIILYMWQFLRCVVTLTTLASKAQRSLRNVIKRQNKYGLFIIGVWPL